VLPVILVGLFVSLLDFVCSSEPRHLTFIMFFGIINSSTNEVFR